MDSFRVGNNPLCHTMAGADNKVIAFKFELFYGMGEKGEIIPVMPFRKREFLEIRVMNGMCFNCCTGFSGKMKKGINIRFGI